MSKRQNHLETIGRRDRIDLPELSLFDVEAKVDTGAYGCALHCHQIQLSKKNGETVLIFKLLDPEHKDYEEKAHLFEKFDQKTVKSSSGETEERFVIRTKLAVFDKDYEVEFSLTDRSSMKYPILLGRKFLSNKFLVDVSQKDLSHHSKKSNQ